MLTESALRENLVRLTTLYGEAAACAASTIGAKAINDCNAIGRIAKGGGFTVSTFDRLVCWMSVNWPDGTAWPRDIPRPTSEDCAIALGRRRAAS